MVCGKLDYFAVVVGSFYDAPPPVTFSELGFDFVKIGAKVLGVLHPFKHLDDTIMVDTDMAGPIAFALILGVCMLFVSLLKGRVAFCALQHVSLWLVFWI
jgi:hypothetical protein